MLRSRCGRDAPPGDAFRRRRRARRGGRRTVFDIGEAEGTACIAAELAVGEERGPRILRISASGTVKTRPTWGWSGPRSPTPPPGRGVGALDPV